MYMLKMAHKTHSEGDGKLNFFCFFFLFLFYSFSCVCVSNRSNPFPFNRKRIFFHRTANKTHHRIFYSNSRTDVPVFHYESNPQMIRATKRNAILPYFIVGVVVLCKSCKCLCTTLQYDDKSAG